MNTIYLSDGKSIQSALCQATENTTIFLEPRVYREKLIISTPNVNLVGVNGKTKIVFDDYAKKHDDEGFELVTFRTYTVAVTANNVHFFNLEIENDAYCPTKKGQAVALYVYADGCYLSNVTLRSAQDTLFVGPLPPDLIDRYECFLQNDLRIANTTFNCLFENCKIFGSVDYVFGCGNAFFVNCEFINVADGRNVGFVCAPSHCKNQDVGFVFYNCSFSEQNCNAVVYLARPWRDYGLATFISCKLSAHVAPQGFDHWEGTTRFETARFNYFDTNVDKPVSWATQLTKSCAERYLSAVTDFEKSIKKTF